jgi:hypothetical protein
MVNTEPAPEQRLRAEGAEQRGGDDSPDAEVVSESSMSLTKQALKVFQQGSHRSLIHALLAYWRSLLVSRRF